MDSPRPGYRSKTEFQFLDEQVAAIIRAAAYHRRDYNLSVVWFSPNKRLAVQTSLSLPLPRLSKADLGSLDRLPLELLHQVCGQLDVCSLFKFRQVNVRANQMITSIYDYQMAISHGLNALCALLRTRLGFDVTLTDFYWAIRRKNCALCCQFSGFIFLPTWTRYCFECLLQASETRMETFASARRRLGLKRRDSSQAGSFRPLPGVYTMEESPYKTRAKLVSVQRADLVSTCKKSFDGQAPIPSRITELLSCQLALEKGIIGPRGEDWVFVARDKVYSFSDFLEHFKWCEQSQLLYKSSQNGTIEPAERPVAAKYGGYFSLRE